MSARHKYTAALCIFSVACAIAYEALTFIYHPGENKDYIGDSRFIESFLEHAFFSIVERDSFNKTHFEMTARKWFRYPEVFGGFCDSVTNSNCGSLVLRESGSHPLRESYRLRGCLELFSQASSFKSEITKACSKSDAQCSQILSSIFYSSTLKTYEFLSSKTPVKESKERARLIATKICATPDWQYF